MEYKWSEFGSIAKDVYDCSQIASSIPLNEYKLRLEAIGGTEPEIVKTLALVNALISVKTAFELV